MNNRRSRSPRQRRDYSLSSLSSGSFENDRTHYSQKSNHSGRGRDSINRSNDRISSRASDKSNRDRKNQNRNIARTSRGYSKEKKVYNKESRYISGIKEKEKQSERGKHLNRDIYESPEEESYLKSASNTFKGREDRTIISEKGTHEVCQNDIEESMRDPSTCNFQGVQVGINEVSISQGTSKLMKEEKKICKDETNDRLERLEKLVELLANNNRKPQPAASSTSQNTWTSNPNELELIPRNTNFTTSMWLNKIEEECIERNFDEKTSIQFMQSNMTGVVKAWFKTVSSYDFTWPELKMLIIETFPDNIDFAATLRMLVERNKKPDETITQYYFSKIYLLEACKISGASAVSCIIDGLENEFWKQEARSYNFLTPEALYTQLLSNFNDYNADYQQKSHELIEVYNFNKQMEKQADLKIVCNEKQFVKNKKCFTCKKFGHTAADCRHAPICYHCQNKGHIAVNCPLKNTNLVY